MDLNDIVNPQDVEMQKKARIFSNEGSITKRKYPKGRKFTLLDILRLISKLQKVSLTIRSLFKTIKLIKSHNHSGNHIISEKEFENLLALMKKCQVSSFGMVHIESSRVYAGKGVPYEYGLLITVDMDREEFKNAPSMDGQIEVMTIYGKTGRAVNRISEYLRSLGLNAVPNHPLGGSIDYAKAGMDAGLGYIGRHGMLIKPENGACHRSAIVYTDIENLGDYVKKGDDHSWIRRYCEECGACIRKCPTEAIRESAIVDKYGNVNSIDYEKCCEGFEKYGCAVCIKECPFTKMGYEKLKEIVKKKRNT